MPWREQPPPWTAATVDGVDDVRATLGSGEIVVLQLARIRGAAGSLELVGQIEGRERCVPLATVVLIQTRHLEFLPVLANFTGGLVLYVGVFLIPFCIIGFIC